MKQTMTPFGTDKIIAQLSDFGDTPATHLLLSSADLSELSNLLGRNIASSDDLLLAARNITTLSVNGVEGTDIVLEPYLLNRLKSRCLTNDFPTFIRERIKELLAGYCGA